jgi:hypothetical protein
MDSTQRDSSGNAPVESAQDSARTDTSAPRLNPTGAAARPDLGDVSDAAALRVPARTLLRRAAPESTSGQSPSAPGVVSPPRSADGAFDRSLEDAPGFAASASPACSASRLQGYGITAVPALIARGTVDGAPVVILLYEDSGKPYADIIRVSDCALVRRQPLG